MRFSSSLPQPPLRPPMALPSAPGTQSTVFGSQRSQQVTIHNDHRVIPHPLRGKPPRPTAVWAGLLQLCPQDLTVHRDPGATHALEPPGHPCRGPPRAMLALEPQATLAQGPWGHASTGTPGPPLHRDLGATLALDPRATHTLEPPGHPCTGTPGAILSLELPGHPCTGTLGPC